MTSLFAESALLPTGWHSKVRIRVQDGRIAAVESGAAPQPGDERHAVLVPGLGNLHSHAFQRGMAGLTEIRGPGDDSFWSWRKIMYGFALAIAPDQLEAVAAQLYVEMLEAGYTRVGEFHYLHHDVDGRPYARLSELAERIAAASAETGMSLTLLPVFYAHAGFGGREPQPAQRRFITSPDLYARLVSDCRGITQALPGGKSGVAPHSLRAVTPEELTAILPLSEQGPIHIHIAEQVQEVEDCVAWSGQRPVEWLLGHVPVNERWTLIHATHMTERETAGMAASGAVAGLCPVTEANLGDGVFPASSFLGAGGHFGVGSDSNVFVSLPEELRQLEYSQRLFHRSRNVIAAAGQSTGERLFTEAVAGGAQSLQGGGPIAVGNDADLVSLDLLACDHLPASASLDQWIFARGVSVDCVWARGVKRVEHGRHAARDAIASRFRAVMRSLAEKM